MVPIPYLADVARLEAARTEAYHAAEAKALDPLDLADIPPVAWAGARVALHPSVRTVASAWPVASIWRAHRDERLDAELIWRAEESPDLPPGLIGGGFPAASWRGGLLAGAWLRQHAGGSGRVFLGRFRHRTREGVLVTYVRLCRSRCSDVNQVNRAASPEGRLL